MKKRLTKRYLINGLDGLNLSDVIRYCRYYIDDRLRIQQKGDLLEKEILDDNNFVVKKEKIDKDEFFELRDKAYSKIIRDSYLYLDDKRVSIKRYYEDKSQVEIAKLYNISQAQVSRLEKNAINFLRKFV